ncbi:bifunctional hydroxymethylpyrimidine kinase/phosphomethylpyrimidine kinase [bacterium]|nr:bifunctional hydroxymethylpyrimidine kinase/phosphomethylpyrimidine kinase [bacterium]MDC0259331.1 bifunctional hydroxymethylpyrimidine kinase/phosphomethylpyrimidine kinase [Verrucomicrobiales bacterium]MDC0276139.1 bifunctional hydroxymethylpyrimidine kinase/phosphomethylpyrimidine kinase [Verrucomicrobiales bacterium]MDC0322559.1 bifunctional hydroxymethylpyrimidine kinase/phosphomethylpyrimidine kinase [Verrucomicrobiales bacterium]
MKAILTIAGSDSSSGAGIQADLKTIAHFGGYGLCAVTSIVAEVPGDVRSIHITPPKILADQLSVLAEHFTIAAVKTGMLATAESATVVADFLDRNPDIPLVVDPVLVASSGQNLTEADTIEVYRNRLIARALVTTPNYAEIRALLDSKSIDPSQLAAEFVARFQAPVLLKGGHLPENSPRPEEATDLYRDVETSFELTTPRLDLPDTHGTGCTLSAAIAAVYEADLPIFDVLSQAKNYLTRALIEAHEFPRPNDAPLRALNHFPKGVS